jgi:excisionase family DNA binding protein
MPPRRAPQSSAQESQPTMGAVLDAALDALVPDLAERVADTLADRLASPSTRSPWFTAEEAADYLRCKPKRIYDLVSQSRLPTHRDGSRLLFHRDELDAYLLDDADTTLTPPAYLASRSRSRAGSRTHDPGVGNAA